MDILTKLHIGRVEHKNNSQFELESTSLTKHAVILGATGSGKTVLSKVIVEEAALHGISTFAIDPKGDIGNLAFKSANFDFSRWSGKEADTLGIDRARYADTLQKIYCDKAAEFKVASSGVSNFAENVIVRIFTPKSSTGLAVGISPDLSVPRNFGKLLETDMAAAADLLDLTTYNLLRLAGYREGDRKEITFVSSMLENAWKGGKSLTIEDIIRNIENPSFSTIGSLPVSKVISDKERKDLVTRINLLISDPKLRSWSSAEPINFSAIFSGPSINILDLRNIRSEQEKHLFVELVLQQLFQWLIKQGSAQTLRYLLYFDEIAGYCPPVREPPSKKLLLLLIKQARAFGLGMLLASQNAIDLDYKIISNANVRFIGRLGAKRDIQRVSLGLELDAGAEREIARLKPGEFFCNIFDTKFKSIILSRWTFTYHRGPLEDSEIAELMAPFKKYKQLDIREQLRDESELELSAQKPELHQFEILAPEVVADDSQFLAVTAIEDNVETFLLLEKKFEVKNLASFVKLGSNLKSLKVLSAEQEEKFHPIFALNVSIFEKHYVKQSLDKVTELAVFGNKLIEVPPELSVSSHRIVPVESRRNAELCKGDIQKAINNIEKDLKYKFDILIEEKRKENISIKSAKPKAKIANIKINIAKMQQAINTDIDETTQYENLYNNLKKENKKKKKNLNSRMISIEYKIQTKKQKIISTRRKIEQLHTNRNALEEKIQQIEREEKNRFYDALGNIRSKTSFGITGWLVETVYRARILINDSKEHYGDVMWSAYTGEGTWGRCSVCSVPLAEGLTCSCGNLLCCNHLAYCKICLEPACIDHRITCYICSSLFCTSHSSKCEVCRSAACTRHSSICSICNRKVCKNCSQKKGLIKREIVCSSCAGLSY